VFAITAGAFVPLNYAAVNLSTAYLHPRVLGSSSNLPPSMALTLLVALVAIALLFATLCSYELTAKRTRMLLRSRSRILGFQGSGTTERRPDAARETPVPTSAPARAGVHAR